MTTLPAAAPGAPIEIIPTISAVERSLVFRDLFDRLKQFPPIRNIAVVGYGNGELNQALSLRFPGANNIFVARADSYDQAIAVSAQGGNKFTVRRDMSEIKHDSLDAIIMDIGTIRDATDPNRVQSGVLANAQTKLRNAGGLFIPTAHTDNIPDLRFTHKAHEAGGAKGEQETRGTGLSAVSEALKVARGYQTGLLHACLAEPGTPHVYPHGLIMVYRRAKVFSH